MLIVKRPEQIKEASAGDAENLDIFIETGVTKGKTITERSAKFTSAVVCT